MASQKPKYTSLEQFMEATGYTQADVARLCHLTQSSVSRILNGKRGCSLKMALQLSRLTRVKIEAFLGEERSPQ